MINSFLSQEFVALALIEAKIKFFAQSFITTSELNEFTIFMQQEFNKKETNIVIVHKLSREDFSINEGVITTTDGCCFNLNMLSDEILNILTDESLTLNFFIQIERSKLETLEKIQSQNSNSCTNNKVKRI